MTVTVTANRALLEHIDVATQPEISMSWERSIEQVVRSLEAQLGSTVDPGLVRAEVEAEFARYSDARVRDFVPVLVESRVRTRLIQPST